MTESLGWTETFALLYLWSCLQRRLRQATSYSKLLQITWSDLMLDWCLRESTSHRVSVVYHSYGGMVDMWHRNIGWSIWALIYSIAGQRPDGHHHRRIQQEEVVWSVMSSCVFLFAWQWMSLYRKKRTKHLCENVRSTHAFWLAPVALARRQSF